MAYQSVSLKKFLKTVRNKPSKALEILNQQPELASMKWEGKSKWIKGSTPLHWAAHGGNLKLVKKLVALGANINANEADWWCRPIDWAADSGQHKVVRYFLKNKAIFSGDRWSNCTPLHIVAQGGSTNGKKNAKGYRKTTKILIKWGAEVNAIAKYGGQPPELTPLDDARNVDNKVVERVLQQHGGKSRKDL